MRPCSVREHPDGLLLLPRAMSGRNYASPHWRVVTLCAFPPALREQREAILGNFWDEKRIFMRPASRKGPSERAKAALLRCAHAPRLNFLETSCNGLFESAFSLK
jgi:hypothetical protein